MRYACLLLTVPGPAFAHAGHLGALAGHDHWIAGAAVGIALGIGLWQAAKDRKARKDDTAADDTTPEQSA
ncbi:hypothetical protein ILP92_12820 [Maribius pontilimi]|uniref:Uncharacterized protein n=1 Tax=Palleronia pontilimi TaxID=1964209 RepID=A0A934IIF5_9RHOB|nr:DUF6732 family protein [Palleronia pontilimi]MBJ3763632.1 hypothetical protein [Palleronia pontilimi]